MIMTYPYVLSSNVSGSALAWEGEMNTALPFIASSGFKGVELLVDHPESVDDNKLSRILADNNLSAIALGTGLLEKRDGLTLVHSDELIRNSAVDEAKKVINLASKLEASVVIGRFRGRWKSLGNKDLAEELFRKSLDQLVHYASERNVGIMLEPQSELASDFCNTVEESLKWLKLFPELKLVCDTFHMQITEKDMFQSLEKAGAKIGLMHMADTERKIPGDGLIDFKKVFLILDKLGYEGPCSIEVRQDPDPQNVCQKSFEFLKTYIKD